MLARSLSVRPQRPVAVNSVNVQKLRAPARQGRKLVVVRAGVVDESLWDTFASMLSLSSTNTCFYLVRICSSLRTTRPCGPVLQTAASLLQ